jgi:hypothetical protein
MQHSNTSTATARRNYYNKGEKDIATSRSAVNETMRRNCYNNEKMLLKHIKNYSCNIRESSVTTTKKHILLQQSTSYVATFRRNHCNKGRDLARRNPSRHQTLRSRGEEEEEKEEDEEEEEEEGP